MNHFNKEFNCQSKLDTKPSRLIYYNRRIRIRKITSWATILGGRHLIWRLIFVWWKEGQRKFLPRASENQYSTHGLQDCGTHVINYDNCKEIDRYLMWITDESHYQASGQ